MMRKRLFILLFFMSIKLKHYSAHPAQDSQHSTANNNSSTTTSSKGGSFLWEIETNPPSFFFGTIHVPYTRVWDAIPLNAKKAFARSHKIFFELDLSDHSTLSLLSACQLLPKGMHLSQVIPSDLYLRVKLHLDYVKKSMPGWITKDQKDRGLTADYLFSTITANWDRKLPVWVMLMIESLTKSDIASRGVPVLDLYLSQQAARHRKKVGAIERVEEQCLALNQINSTLVLFALNETLKEQEDIRLGLSSPRITVDDLIEHYRRGNLDSVLFSTDTMLFPTLNLKSASKEGSSVSDSRWSEEDHRLAKEFDRIFQEYFLLRRNKQMASRVISVMASNPKTSFFFAFGAGHFVGQNSVLAMMRSAGFQIRQIFAEDSLHKHESSVKSHDFQSGFDGTLNGNNKNTVQGTFEDLSEEEKTRALLQFLQYHQQQEQESETSRFKEMIQNGENKQEGLGNLSRAEIQDEKVVEESLKVWYGISAANVVTVVSLQASFLSVAIVVLVTHFLPA